MFKKQMNSAIGITALLLLAVNPCRMLLADYYFNKALQILDDPATEEQDRIAISAETAGTYENAIAKFEKAAALAPERSSYYKALADVYLQMGKWHEVMEVAGVTVPEGVMSRNEAHDKAYGCLKKAVLLNYTNADYHLALGHLYILMGEPAEADRELQGAIEAYPHNAPLQVQVALEYLVSGEKGAPSITLQKPRPWMTVTLCRRRRAPVF